MGSAASLRLFVSYCAVFFLFVLQGHVVTISPQPLRAELVAATPPMGWNNWDSYGRTLNEASIKARAEWMARHLKRFAWEYVVLDEDWHLANLDATATANHTRSAR